MRPSAILILCLLGVALLAGCVSEEAPSDDVKAETDPALEAEASDNVTAGIPVPVWEAGWVFEHNTSWAFELKSMVSIDGERDEYDYDDSETMETRATLMSTTLGHGLYTFLHEGDGPQDAFLGAVRQTDLEAVATIPLSDCYDCPYDDVAFGTTEGLARLPFPLMNQTTHQGDTPSTVAEPLGDLGMTRTVEILDVVPVEGPHGATEALHIQITDELTDASDAADDMRRDLEDSGLDDVQVELAQSVTTELWFSEELGAVVHETSSLLIVISFEGTYEDEEVIGEDTLRLDFEQTLSAIHRDEGPDMSEDEVLQALHDAQSAEEEDAYRIQVEGPKGPINAVDAQSLTFEATVREGTMPDGHTIEWHVFNDWYDLQPVATGDTLSYTFDTSGYYAVMARALDEDGDETHYDHTNVVVHHQESPEATCHEVAVTDVLPGCDAYAFTTGPYITGLFVGVTPGGTPAGTLRLTSPQGTTYDGTPEEPPEPEYFELLFGGGEWSVQWLPEADVLPSATYHLDVRHDFTLPADDTGGDAMQSRPMLIERLTQGRTWHPLDLVPQIA